jgi:hypothetical protein
LRRRSPHFTPRLTTAAAFSRSKFDAALDALRRELGKLRTGRASPGARLLSAPLLHPALTRMRFPS